jgi:hypothetical protein
MCGIAGFIGVSRNKKLSNLLITELFRHLESRGTDAAGVYATTTDGKVVYHKEPIKSSEFVKGEFWDKIQKQRFDLMLTHARATSKGGGNAAVNCNNHPFVTADHRIGMVHNGTIEEAEVLTEQYETNSATDSECLLRIFEHALDQPLLEEPGIKDAPDEVKQRLGGIKNIFSYIFRGAMAVAFGERLDEQARRLILFRNEKRPIWIADLRPLLGQIFFFSTPDIWWAALGNNSAISKKLAYSAQKLIELPSNQIWVMDIDKNNPHLTLDNLWKFKANTSYSSENFTPNGILRPKPPLVKDIEVITDLGPKDILKTHFQTSQIKGLIGCEDEEPLTINGHYTSTTSPNVDLDPSLYDEDTVSFDDSAYEEVPIGCVAHEEICEEIVTLIEKIKTIASNKSMEGSFNAMDYSTLIESLEQAKLDLAGTCKILD